MPWKIQIGERSFPIFRNISKPLAQRPTHLAHGEPPWVQADPTWVHGALNHGLRKPGGGWFVLDASARIQAPRKFVIHGQELVAWRAEGHVCVAPAACPHLGADLSCASVRKKSQQGTGQSRDVLVCPWHGLELGAKGRGAWQPYNTCDDGVLCWVQLPPTITGLDERLTQHPLAVPQPDHFIPGVLRKVVKCDPQDVIANRLDPWHSAANQPQRPARVTLLDRTEESIAVRAAFRVLGPLVVEVDATFHCSDPRTVVMTIVQGEGAGSMVCTHATPMGPGETAIVEVTYAVSDRPEFSKILPWVARVVSPVLEYRANLLWKGDQDYAERRYALRTMGKNRGIAKETQVVARGPGQLLPLARKQASETSANRTGVHGFDPNGFVANAGSNRSGFNRSGSNGSRSNRPGRLSARRRSNPPLLS